MKKTLSVLVASLLSIGAATAHATVLFYAPNTSGGTIQFSDMPCSDLKGAPRVLKKKTGLVSVIIDSGGSPVMFGCYSIHNPNIVVTWEDGSPRFYPVANVTWTDEGRAEIEAAKASLNK